MSETDSAEWNCRASEKPNACMTPIGVAENLNANEFAKVTAEVSRSPLAAGNPTPDVAALALEAD
jgi:hypothetical protein